MRKLLATFAAVILILNIDAQTVEVSSSEKDSKIIVDGQDLGTGTLKVKVPRDVCVNVKIQKPGFLKYWQHKMKSLYQIECMDPMDSSLTDEREKEIIKNQLNRNK